ncbi:MAG: ferrous iron transport protein B [Agathobaculum sp.]|uniref:ferrous iron transport protein B n=1 Tax=Agathobaculum sp. TaxID=2048138 RepID=UPI002A81D116|nr:ferrous iron transport protein B [Agathobaculum sp.]MDY3711691.1 ferrous iron transport protein B [Agathobaculum sp.]
MSIRLALAGNPNCGKTTMFNALTGATQYVGNWPGVTVEKKEGRWKEDKDVRITDLPGIYSLSPYTLEEVVTRDYLVGERPDCIMDLVDASNIERNLYLTTQLLEMGMPVVVALNMMDIVEGRGDVIDTAGLSKALGVPVVETAAIKGKGIGGLIAAAKQAAAGAAQPPLHRFSDEIENALSSIETMIADVTEAAQRRWFAIKLFERDEKVLSRFHFGQDTRDKLEAVIAAVEDELDDDAESIITDARYRYIAEIVGACVKKKRKGASTSDKIDHVVTNRILALPIFALVMFIVYYVSVSTVGTLVTDWTNDVLFGEIVPPAVEGFLTAVGCADWLMSLILDGIVAGVGAVLGFVPQMLVLFFFLAVLEDCGYMARVAFIMDRIFRKFGLSGKSFIPMLIGSGCGVPGVMASRTIEQTRDRRMTIMTTCFIPCGAKLPIIALIAGAFFGNAGWVAFSAYLVGILAIVLSGIILKKFKAFAGDPAPFVMELPAYHVPAAGNVLRSMWERGWSFIKKAGTIILLSTIVVWFLQTYGFENGSFGAVEEIENCLLAALGNAIAPLFTPLGFGDWRGAVSAISGLVAKENVVATFGQLFHFTGELSEAGDEIWGELAGHYTAVAAYAYMVFNLLCAPCFAAIGAIKREMNNAKWTWFAIGYMTVFAYTVSLMIYQFAGLATGELAFGAGAVAAILILAVYIYLLFRKPAEAKTEGLRGMSVQAG